MALEITITQRSLFKKVLLLEDITEDRLRYGTYDNHYRLKEKSLSGDNIIFYDKNHIGRGVSVNYSEGMKNDLHMTLPMPCTSYDVDVLFDIIENVLEKWKSEIFTIDGTSHYIEELPFLKQDIKNDSLQLLSNIRSTLNNSDVDIMPCVKWPLYLSTSKLEEFGHNRDELEFARYLHKLQSQDIYCAVCNVYEVPHDHTHLGVYAVTSQVRTKLPLKPLPPLFARDPETGQPLFCDSFAVMLVSRKDNEVLGQVSYSNFLKEIEVDTLDKYDEAHVILPPLSEERIREILLKYED